MKKPVSPEAAVIHLQRAFAEARPSTCKDCRFPAQFWGPAVGPGPGYWYIKMPAPCPHGCLAVIARLWAAYTTVYEIQREPYDASSHREQRTRFPRLNASRDALGRRQNER